MRLFVGISPSDEIRKALIKAQHFLSRHGITGSCLTQENLHMTLVFIGEYPDADPVLDAMEAASFDPFPITYSHIGTFRESIVWGGIDKSESVESLSKRLRYELAKAEIPFDNSGFVPHFTLVRHADFSKGIPPVGITPVSMTVQEITLFRSDRGKNGMLYTPVGIVEASRSALTEQSSTAD